MAWWREGKGVAPESDDDGEPQVQSWGEAKRRGGAVAWEDLADDLLDEDGSEPEAAENEEEEVLEDPAVDAGQPHRGRPPVARSTEDLWPAGLPGETDGPEPGGPARGRPGSSDEEEGDPSVPPSRSRVPRVARGTGAVGEFEVTRDRRGPMEAPGDLWARDEPEVRKDRRAPAKAALDVGHVEVRQDTRSGVRHVRDLEEE